MTSTVRVSHGSNCHVTHVVSTWVSHATQLGATDWRSWTHQCVNKGIATCCKQCVLLLILLVTPVYHICRALFWECSFSSCMSRRLFQVVSLVDAAHMVFNGCICKQPFENNSYDTHDVYTWVLALVLPLTPQTGPGVNTSVLLLSIPTSGLSQRDEACCWCQFKYGLWYCNWLLSASDSRHGSLRQGSLPRESVMVCSSTSVTLPTPCPPKKLRQYLRQYLNC